MERFNASHFLQILQSRWSWPEGIQEVLNPRVERRSLDFILSSDVECLDILQSVVGVYVLRFINVSGIVETRSLTEGKHQ